MRHWTCQNLSHWDKHILVKKATIFWEYHNVGKNETHYYTIKKVGTVISSLVQLDEGYWTLKDIAKKLSTKGATLTESSIDGKCTISMGGEYTLMMTRYLKKLLGYTSNVRSHAKHCDQKRK